MLLRSRRVSFSHGRAVTVQGGIHQLPGCSEGAEGAARGKGGAEVLSQLIGGAKLFLAERGVKVVLRSGSILICAFGNLSSSRPTPSLHFQCDLLIFPGFSWLCSSILLSSSPSLAHLCFSLFSKATCFPLACRLPIPSTEQVLCI